MSYACFAAYYDSLTEDVDYEVRSAYISNFFIRYGITDGIVLDLACGTGRMSIELANRGYDVIGVDASPDMLCEARENAAEAGHTNILFLCQRMERLDLFGTVRGCVCALDSINHLTRPEDVLSAFQKVSLFMEPGGVFVFDVNTAYKHREILGNQTFALEEEEVYLVWQNAYDPQTDTVEITLDFFERDGEAYFRETETFCERAYTVRTLTKLLEQSGFALLHIYDELTESAPRPDSQRLYFIVRKI